MTFDEWIIQNYSSVADAKDQQDLFSGLSIHDPMEEC